MRENTGLIVFVAIILFILFVYVVSALYFDGLIQLFQFLGYLLAQAYDAVVTLFEAIYRTFFA